MKKIAPIAALALFAVAFTSCKKDYTCECKMNGTVISTTTIHAKKSDAKSACSATATVGSTTMSCELK
jgi:hypothetical protein